MQGKAGLENGGRPERSVRKQRAGEALGGTRRPQAGQRKGPLHMLGGLGIVLNTVG